MVDGVKAKNCVLLFLLRGDDILLAMKKRGFGSGRWNGVGGKIEPNETLEQAAVRECQEEIGVTPKNMQKVAYHEFVFPSGTADMLVHVFIARDWEGEPMETEEMRPQWFKLHDIPYDQMWQDDIFWLPAALLGHTLQCRFVFNANEQMLDAQMKILDNVAALEPLDVSKRKVKQ
jgi:mutator protein MutT